MPFDMVKDAKESIVSLVGDAISRAENGDKLQKIDGVTIEVERPADRKNGDFSSNVALKNAKAFALPPKKAAEILLEHLDLSGSYFEKAFVAGPGFLNFSLAPKWFSETVEKISSDPLNYGKSESNKGQKIMVEFVSANPTGPMHMGNARGGACGDAVSSLLEMTGASVTREFYVNDAGNQIDKFGRSLEARYIKALKGESACEFPEDGYQGEDIRTRAKEYIALFGEDLLFASAEERRRALTAFSLEANISDLKSTLKKYRIEYDVWFSESSLYESGEVEKTLETLKKNGYAYEEGGALFFAHTKMGGEKDEVLVRANGFPTYFAADIAYHKNKLLTRGFDRAIDVWGADHHGHIQRMKDALTAIGLDGSRLDVITIQLVRLMQNGEAVRMSKRTGKSITLSDLLEETGVDAARFFFTLRQASSHFDFDLDLAVEQSSQNPVYYVQYAHARICSILRTLSGEGFSLKPAQECDLSLLSAPEEKELILHLANFPGEIESAARALEPSGVTRYATELAACFHKFYTACRVKDEDDALMQARAHLIFAVKSVLHTALSLVDVTAPESM